MKPSKQQIEFYNENGYLKIENYFSEGELQKLISEFPNTVAKDSERIIREDNGSIRSVFAPHFVNEVYNRLARLDRMIIPAEQLIGSKVYLHQYKINTKKGFKGDWWEWHQDFPYWYFDDGIKTPQLITIMLYLQDTDASNGALLIIPKSHKSGIAKFAEKEIEISNESSKQNHLKSKEYLSSLNANIKFTVNQELVRQLAEQNGIVTASGKKGTVLFFHSNIFHASNINMTPFDRDAILITYNSITNCPTNVESPRPDFLVGRNYEPIIQLETGL